MRYGRDVYKALDQLTVIAEGRTLLEMLHKDFNESVQSLLVYHGEELTREQGRAQYLNELIDRFEQANKLKSP